MVWMWPLETHPHTRMITDIIPACPRGGWCVILTHAPCAAFSALCVAMVLALRDQLSATQRSSHLQVVQIVCACVCVCVRVCVCVSYRYKHISGALGTGNFTECLELLSQRFPQAPCKHEQCSIGGAYLPRLTGTGHDILCASVTAQHKTC